ncbi:MAG TPA: nucleoside triphosphate pyrophosphohydrolase [Chitinophagales bacterium]|nr:nucleoside triphosphate pyrophosphohydrolase [Chitinophagales bacterium]MCB9075683.1 nucleoside triphosphate pyrophosphohydrolase [Chitinophagales bacterium]HMU98697.1 nucleoside triphosphate pyrophosphohydrolase [Chitinophagales bacterium]HMV03331.1 nucleoside triphosphate pyrophosphohydrolase [Chitinophagales bacterium]HMW95274.1 nucleoside triphosphate pyrophosphohydrolase [Chitinophagales bacterium]
MDKNLKAFENLLNIMNDLREKCPWDKKQTIQSLRKLTIEETYELADAILKEDWENIKEELGDLFLHLVFYAKIAQEQQRFDVAEVLDSVCQKLIFRHPHIYGDVKVENEDDVKRNWELLKLQEGKKSVLGGVPDALPPINKAQRIQEKAKNVGFEWENKFQVWAKVVEEIGELEEAEKSENIDKIEDEFGDVLFALINYARFLKIDAEEALERTNQKFIQRFNFMENYANSNNIALSNMSLEEMEALWVKAKGK